MPHPLTNFGLQPTIFETNVPNQFAEDDEHPCSHECRSDDGANNPKARRFEGSDVVHECWVEDFG